MEEVEALIIFKILLPAIIIFTILHSIISVIFKLIGWDKRTEFTDKEWNIIKITWILRIIIPFLFHGYLSEIIFSNESKKEYIEKRNKIEYEKYLGGQQNEI